MEGRNRSRDAFRQRSPRLNSARRPLRDLILLVADKNMEYGVRGLLSRPKALGVRSIDAQIIVHVRRDPGCVHEAHDFLRPFIKEYRHALVMFDREGSGREAVPGDSLEEEVRRRLAASGWDTRGDVIVLDPELEIWVFTGSPHVERCLGWQGTPGTLRGWLRQQNLWPEGRAKPEKPRETLERVLRRLNRPRSSSLYECLGRRVGLRGCTDPAFVKFTRTLSIWFPASKAG